MDADTVIALLGSAVIATVLRLSNVLVSWLSRVLRVDPPPPITTTEELKP